MQHLDTKLMRFQNFSPEQEIEEGKKYAEELMIDGCILTLLSHEDMCSINVGSRSANIRYFATLLGEHALLKMNKIGSSTEKEEIQTMTHIINTELTIQFLFRKGEDFYCSTEIRSQHRETLKEKQNKTRYHSVKEMIGNLMLKLESVW
jgi:hypothetical protein